MQSRQSPLGRIIARHAAKPINEALLDTRVILVNGARQCGKSTLAWDLAKEHGAEWFSLDRPQVYQTALHDPVSFVLASNPMAIDEIQRAPQLLLPIKEVVDQSFEPGRFLLTGSARLLGMKALPDSLLGRMETIELWPLSQGEIDSAPDNFIDAAFNQGPDIYFSSDLTRDDYIERLIKGGFPEALARSCARRIKFFESYVSDLVNRDVKQVADIEKSDHMVRLIELLAHRSGNLLNVANLSNSVHLSSKTLESYISLLEEVFLLKRIPAWTRNIDNRGVRMPKVAFVDSGIAASLAGQDERELKRITSEFGGLLEGFVAMELAKQLTWCEERASMFHFRNRDKIEVDLILENRRHQVIGIEVKASATPDYSDFKGLRYLQNRLGEDFIAGFVFYLGDQTLPFGDKMRALPLNTVWQYEP